jgi:hypothetical protein
MSGYISYCHTRAYTFKGRALLRGRPRSASTGDFNSKIRNPSWLTVAKTLRLSSWRNRYTNRAKRHFYHLDDSHITPPVAEQVGILGYPGATRLTVDQNFMATPYVSFGEMVGIPVGSDPNSRISIRYPTSHSVDPHGLSGCGLWVAEKNSADQVWTPAISLIGLVTDWLAQPQLLVGYRVEELVNFLNAKHQWMKED